jgi:hypothetical protein
MRVSERCSKRGNSSDCARADLSQCFGSPAADSHRGTAKSADKRRHGLRMRRSDKFKCFDDAPTDIPIRIGKSEPTPTRLRSQVGDRRYRQPAALEVNSVVWLERRKPREEIVNGLIYLVGLIVVIMFILSFLGLR